MVVVSGNHDSAARLGFAALPVAHHPLLWHRRTVPVLRVVTPDVPALRLSRASADLVGPEWRATGALLVGRIVTPLWTNARHKLKVVAVVPESDNVTSIYMQGRDLDRLDAKPGQFFIWRFPGFRHWWRANPFSLSAAPDGRTLRLTVRAVVDTAMLGEFSLEAQQAAVRAVFVPLSRLQPGLEIDDRVNTVLVALDDDQGATAIDRVTAQVRATATLEDLGLRVRSRGAQAEGPQLVIVESDADDTSDQSHPANALGQNGLIRYRLTGPGTNQNSIQLTGAEDALVVNNGAAALLLALMVHAHGREAIVDATMK